MDRGLESRDDEGDTLVSRRTLLRNGVASIAATTALAGCGLFGGDDPGERNTAAPDRDPAERSPGGAADQVEQPAAWENFSVTRVDVTPGDEVSGIVRDVEPNELLVFPAGRFRWSRETTVTTDGWGIWCQPDTVFEVPPGFGDGEEGEVISTDTDDETADDFLLKNLAFDSDGRAAPGLGLGVRQRATVDGLEYWMNGPMSNGTQENGIRAYVEDPDGQLTITDYAQFNNGNIGNFGDGDGRIGIWVGPRHEGTVHLDNPVLQGFPNNACYVSHHQGTVLVEGGLLMNNNVAAVRVSDGVEVRDTTIVIDVDRFREGDGVVEGREHNTRGLWGDSSGAGSAGGIATGVSFVINSYERSTGLATILQNPLMTLRDCQFALNTDTVGIRADGGEIAVEGGNFVGSAEGAVAGIETVSGSDNNVAPRIDPGDVPFSSRTNRAFDWNRTHLLTPGRFGALVGSSDGPDPNATNSSNRTGR